jgi:hypothetical protein
MRPQVQVEGFMIDSGSAANLWLLRGLLGEDIGAVDASIMWLGLE